LDSFTAIDFETANARRGSVCSVGLAKVERGVVTGRYYSLIQPPTGVFDFSYFNTQIHGITSEDVLDAPDWAEVYAQIRRFAGADVLVAHNAVFDKSCLMQANSLLHIKGEHDFVCTCQNARRLLPQLPNHKLPTVAAALAVRLDNHHNALDDAVAAARIAVELSRLGDLL